MNREKTVTIFDRDSFTWILKLCLRTAIYTPCPQSVPNKPAIDASNCLKLTKGRCGICAKVCATNAVVFEDVDKLVEYSVGAIVVATGFDLFGKEKFGKQLFFWDFKEKS